MKFYHITILTFMLYVLDILHVLSMSHFINYVYTFIYVSIYMLYGNNISQFFETWD